MARKRTINRRIVIGFLAVCVLATIGGGAAALASTPDSNGVIHACYKPQADGHATALSVIDTAKTHGQCPAGQKELTWQQAGGDGMIYARVDKFVPYGQGVGASVTGVVVCPSGYIAVSGGYGPNGSTTGYIQEQWTPMVDLGGPAIQVPQNWQISLVEMGPPYTGGGGFTESFFANCLPTS
jgi:hypothetical protein